MNQERWLAYTRGELSLEDAKAVEAELAGTAPEVFAKDAMQGDGSTMSGSEDEVRAALRSLDAIEVRHAPTKRHAWDAPRARWPLAVAVLAAAAAIALVIWSLRGPANNEPEIATPPLIVAPATRLADDREVSDASVAKADDIADGVADVSRVAAVDSAVSDTGPSAPIVDPRRIGARNGRALLIDLDTSPLGRGAAWRHAEAAAGRDMSPRYLRVRAHPAVETLVTSGLLDAIVRCIDESRTPGRDIALTVVRGGGKSRPEVIVTLGAEEPREDPFVVCIEKYPVVRAAWRQSRTRFELELTSMRYDAIPDKSLGKQPAKGPPR